jgi:hypothetical protein
MKSRITVLVTAMAMVLVFASVSLAAKVLFEDKFATLDPSWGAPSAIMNVKAGKFMVTPEKNTTQTIINQANVFPNDAEITYTMTFVKAPEPTWGSGLVFWAKDYSSYYALLMNANGWFAVQHHVANRYLLPVAWRSNPDIKKGAGAVNEVKVVTKGNKATISVNGKDLITITGQPPQGGSLIGFKVASGTKGSNTVAFGDLKVTQP